MTMLGIHHVTAISGRAYRNLDFYTGTLGMRFVKKTVNFDDPGTYHLYYGDEVGHPGTILTFFPWEHALAGRSGVGFAHQTAFCVPANSLGYWTHRFIEKGVPHEPMAKRFGEPVLAFADPDGMRLALVGVAEAETGWSNGDVPAEPAIRGFHGVTLLLNDVAATGAILADVLGFAKAGTAQSAVIARRVRAPAPWSIFMKPTSSCAAQWAAARCTTSRFAPRTMPRRPRWRPGSVTSMACNRPSRRVWPEGNV
jgi:glyoxalase family protein